MGKGILYGVLAMVIFTPVDLLLLIPLFSLIPGDDFTMSFHLFTYGGVTLLCGVVVTCTYLVLRKLDQVHKNEKQ
ncbi:MAG TPA: hypothetical protein IAA56_01520 [Candidatus Galloscillospira excrementavium]|nr:hypothetical protein [Candidatus Galloscillospira excrementavium]